MSVQLSVCDQATGVATGLDIGLQKCWPTIRVSSIYIGPGPTYRWANNAIVILHPQAIFWFETIYWPNNTIVILYLIVILDPQAIFLIEPLCLAGQLRVGDQPTGVATGSKFQNGTLFSRQKTWQFLVGLQLYSRCKYKIFLHPRAIFWFEPLCLAGQLDNWTDHRSCN